MTDLTRDGVAAARPQSTLRAVSVWDPLVRLIHWGVAGAVLANATFVDEDSSLHEVLGYTALALVGVRLIWGLVGTRHARFSAFPPNPLAAVRHVFGLAKGRRKVHLSHNPAGALMAYNMWLSVIGTGVTGYMMGTRAFFGVDWVEEAHEAMFAWIMISLVLHLGGVLLDSRLTRVRLIPAMITGRKRVNARDVVGQ